MKTIFEPDLKSKTFCISKSYALQREKKIDLVNTKFYQNLFTAFVLLSTFLIFPESPRELENICQNYNSKQLCNVW